MSSYRSISVEKYPIFTKPMTPSFLKKSWIPPVVCTTRRHNANTHHPKTLNPIIVSNGGQNKNKNKKKGLFDVGNEQMFVLCGFGYWVQGFRCFPWLALNFHMAHNLSLRPSTLQLVQHSGNLPMVAKPLYGLLSDTTYIGGAHRIPYISVGGTVIYLFIHKLLF